MTRKTIMSVLAALISLSLYSAEISRVEPAFWWTGMKNHELQVMFYGPGISNARVSLDYPGVTLKEVCSVESPNYLFAYLDITDKAQPGTMEFVFTEGKKSTKQTFELLPRNTKPGAMGFNKSDVLYLIMPDRFSNGNPSNDEYEGYKVNRQNGGGRHGGDIKGIVNHLDYIKDLGVTAIWLNPVQYNKGGASHGYAISDFYLIDPRLGSNQEYCDMVDAAHAKGIKVVMDMIFNHSGSSHWWMSDLPSSDWYNQGEIARKMGQQAQQPQQQRGQVRMPSSVEDFNKLSEAEKAEVMRRYNRNNNDGLINTTHYKWTLMDPHAPQSEKDILTDGWFTRGMPDLNQRNRHLATYLIQNSIWWIEYSRIDGIRMDTYPYADYDFMARWCNELLAEYPDFNIVGEGWYPRNSAAGWWQRGSQFNHDGNTGLKTVMDFDLTFTAQREFLKESNTSEGSEAGLFKIYETISQDFLIPDPDNVLVFLDNHDISRFMQEGDPIWKFKQGMTLLLTNRGIPQIYYGTEIMMTGDKSKGGDAMVRADFPGGWEGDSRNAFTAAGRTDAQNEAWTFVSKLLNWRQRSKAIAEGHMIHYTPDNQTKCYVYAQTNGTETVLVVINGSDKEQTLNMARFKEVTAGFTKGHDVTSGATIDITGTVSVPARGTYVLDLLK